MERSQYIQRANDIIEKTKGKTLSIEERRVAALELASLMLKESRRVQTTREHRQQGQLERMMSDPMGKAFTTSLTDECFRSHIPARVADQILFLLQKFGIPKFLSYFRQLELFAFSCIGSAIPSLLVPLAKRMLRQETASVILPGEAHPLARHMEKRKRTGIRVNLNHLGEAILGEEEAQNRLRVYLGDLEKAEVEYISVKISTIYSQIHLLAWEQTLQTLQERLKQLYRAAMQHTFVRPGGKCVPKFVNLDMEEYRDLHLTVELFRRVLDDPEFFRCSAGIVLQSYLPDSFIIQTELTAWAMKRVAAGGAPIKIRIVKGANLAMEKVEASIKGWQQAPYTTKADVDANYKRMLDFALTPEHAKAAIVGVASHNLFDIAYALLMRAERGVEPYVEFEMLEGMADPMRRVVQTLSGSMLLYCPAATKKEFQNAVAYLIRRLDENTAPENFLRHVFSLIPGTKEWQSQATHFSLACHGVHTVSDRPRRRQNRFEEPRMPDPTEPFCNEPDTDWSLLPNMKWGQNLLHELKNKTYEDVPIVIGGKEIWTEKHFGVGSDPSRHGQPLYRYALADATLIDKALLAAQKAEKRWAETTIEARCATLAKLAHLLRINRGELIAAMVADGGKTVAEADAEVSEAVDFAEYYRRNMSELHHMDDIEWKPKGTILVAPPWNFPCSIPLGGIAAALAAGNCVLFKPAPETVYVGWRLAKLCWEAGVGRDVLQFIACEDHPVGSALVKDPRVAAVVLTGATSTAKMMLKMRPGLDLIAETGGKNGMIITSMSDRDLAVRDLVHSAFMHAGQKCSACSLAVCEAEVYDDPHFRRALRDAAQSLKVGSARDPSTRVSPLIHPPGETLSRALTTLEEGEEWLLEPKQDPTNPNLWSPGIKLGVKEGSFTHMNELFGPVLGVMRAKSLDDAIRIVNSTPYGLTSGIHSLDERETTYWAGRIEAGNCYVNRTITGAIVQRQPFGGWKESSFGSGAKAGGPNYLLQMMAPRQATLPKQIESVDSAVKLLSLQLEKLGITPQQMELWNGSVGSYAYFWKHYFSKEHDPNRVVGQDNILRYAPHPRMVLRVQEQDSLFDVLRVIAAALTCGTPMEVSGDKKTLLPLTEADWVKLTDNIRLKPEGEAAFIDRVMLGKASRVRVISTPTPALQQAFAEAACNVIAGPVLANGRIELFRYLREKIISSDYHRYGNLGIRESEERAPLL